MFLVLVVSSMGEDTFFSDESGHKVTDNDFTVTGPNGENESIPWTFENYLKASSV